jgi:hypothetical protein
MLSAYRPVEVLKYFLRIVQWKFSSTSQVLLKYFLRIVQWKLSSTSCRWWLDMPLIKALLGLPISLNELSSTFY